MSKEKKKGRPRKLSAEERLARMAAYQREWRAKNPYIWKEILKRSQAKRRAAKKASGVEVELDVSGLDAI